MKISKNTKFLKGKFPWAIIQSSNFPEWTGERQLEFPLPFLSNYLSYHLFFFWIATGLYSTDIQTSIKSKYLPYNLFSRKANKYMSITHIVIILKMGNCFIHACVSSIYCLFSHTAFPCGYFIITLSDHVTIYPDNFWLGAFT